MKIISWNIAGGRPIKSSGMFDYLPEDITYFADKIKKFNPDLVCLQETHLTNTRSIASEIAKLVSIDHIFETSAKHQSHIDPSYQLGTAILSKTPFTGTSHVQLTDPEFDLFWSPGRKVEEPMHHKFLQTATIDGVTIANIQLLPLHIFGSSYTEGHGAQLAELIDDTFYQHLKEPLIFCGDFNFDTPREIFPKLFASINLNDALPREPTDPTQKITDHILISKQFEVVTSKIEKTQTDHYLCFAEISGPTL